MSSNKSPLKAILEFLQRFVKSPRFIKISKITSIGAGIILILFFVAWFSLRGWILNTAYAKIQNKLNTKGYTLTVQEKGFDGIFGVYFNDIYLKSVFRIKFTICVIFKGF